MTVPLHSAEHMYIVTGRIDGVHPDLPVLRDPDGYIYFKEEVGGLLMGGFEPDAKPWGMDGIPDDFEFGMLPDDWDQFEILMENALMRVPALETAEIKTFMNGPESFTPDNNFILGEAPELKNFFVGAGFNSIGIASGGGAGARSPNGSSKGEPTLDLWPVDIRRFARFHNNDALPAGPRQGSARPALHDAVAEPRACTRRGRCAARRSMTGSRRKRALFGSKMGWERPNWFAADAGRGAASTIRSGGRTGFPTRRPSTATREAVAIFDQTSFAKFLLQGRDAEAVLQRLCANDVAVPVGTTVYTGLLNARGGYESDLTVARLAADRFLHRHRHGAGDARRRLDPPQHAADAHARR